jgi:predicted nucleotidyltransferase
MSCHISSEKLNNPLLKELLATLTTYFNSIESEYYVIGATARDIVLTAIYEQDARRSTADLDIAIAIPNWEDFESIEKGLCLIEGFEKSKNQRQRFIYKEIYLLDIVPFGGVAKEDGNIYWPPEEEVAMSVAGFPEAAKDVLEVNIDNEFSIKVVQLPGIFLLKLNAFKDRHLDNNKDADDIAYIISCYLEINQDRAIENHYDIYKAENFTTFVAGATLLGRDIKRILSESPQVFETFIGILQTEIDAAEESPLINQMLETHAALKYEEVFDGLQNLLKQFK